MSATFTIELLPDYDTRPDEFDCYDAADITAWKNDEWRYVGVRVKATIRAEGYDLDAITDGLWGVEYGYFDNNEAYVRGIAGEQWAALPDDLRAQFGELPADTRISALA
jgi:hypothetical protein